MAFSSGKPNATSHASERPPRSSRVDLRLKRATRFDETLTVTCWIERVRHASLSFGYQIHCSEELSALAHTEHAVINLQGKPVRIPEPQRARLLALAAPKSA